MKPLLILIAALTISCNCFAQNDTAIIRKVFDYLNTDGFRRACVDSIKAEYKYLLTVSKMNNRTRQNRLVEQAEDTNAIAGNTCFVSLNHYKKNGEVFQTDTLQPQLDSTGKWFTINWPSMRDYISPITCDRKIIGVVRFEANGKVTVEYYNSNKKVAWGSYLQGTTHFIELVIEPGGDIKFTGYSSTIYN